MLARHLGHTAVGFGFADGDDYGRLHGRRAGQHFPPHAKQRMCWQGAAVPTDQAADDRCLPPRAERGGLAGPGDMLDHLGPLHQQVMDRVVDAVEFGAQG